jgi:hypothetical protein
MPHSVCEQPTDGEETVILVECDIIETRHVAPVQSLLGKAQCYRKVDKTI